MHVYVITDGEVDWLFTASLDEEGALDRLDQAMRARRVLIDPRRELKVKRLTGWDHVRLKIARAEFEPDVHPQGAP